YPFVEPRSLRRRARLRSACSLSGRRTRLRELDGGANILASAALPSVCRCGVRVHWRINAGCPPASSAAGLGHGGLDVCSRVGAMLGLGVGSRLGAGVLVRGVMLLYPFVLVVLVVMILAKRVSPTLQSILEGWRAAGLGSLALLLGFALILTPWTVRNYRVH